MNNKYIILRKSNVMYNILKKLQTHSCFYDIILIELIFQYRI